MSGGEESSLPQLYAGLMKTAFAPALRKAGLRGSNGRFALPSPTHWAQLGFQKSQYNGVDHLRFTINLSVVSRDRWAEELAIKPYLGRCPTPNVLYGTWVQHARIGTLLPGGEDKWWLLEPAVALGPVQDDVLADLTAYAIPWLHQHAARAD